MRILIVDDEEDFLARLRRILASSPHGVVEASDGREALAVLAREPIDLVITDVVMPNMDGLELMRNMRRAHRGVKTIVLSASDYSQDEVFLKIARLMGAAGAFKKPVSSAELMPVVESLARGTKAIEQSGRLLGMPAPRSAPRSGMGKPRKALARAGASKRGRRVAGKKPGKASAKTYRNPVAEAAMEQARRRAAA